MMNGNNDVYPASDLTEIAYLFCKDVPLQSTERQGSRVIFNFEGYETCRRLVTDIGYGRDQVSLIKALEQVRRARHFMHNT